MRRIYDIIFHKPMNFSFVDDYLCASARIMSERDISWIKQRGIKAILTLTKDPIPTKWVNGAGIESFHVPIRNHRAPTTEQLSACVNFIERNVMERKKTLVHCAAGKGRTGTVLASYICNHDNISAERAIELVRSSRPGSVEKNPKSGQESAVIEFRKFLQGQKESRTA